MVSGSKLKSPSAEYKKITEYLRRENIEFIWITDGAG